jgi:hypothetical protein
MRTPTPKLTGPLRWLRWVGVAVAWGGAVIGAVAISHFAKLNLWACLGVAVGAILINGWVITLEDDLPGGFNNPDGKRTPRYAVIAGWVVRGVGVVAILLLLLMLALSVLGSR